MTSASPDSDSLKDKEIFRENLVGCSCIVIINDSGVMRLDISYNMSISCVCMSVY